MPERNEQQPTQSTDQDLCKLFQTAGHHAPGCDLTARIMARVAVTPLFRPKVIRPLIGQRTWVVMAVAFSTYLVNFNTFASTYASLSGVFAAMFFVYLSALVMILGGEVNRVLAVHRLTRSETPALVELTMEDDLKQK